MSMNRGRNSIKEIDKRNNFVPKFKLKFYIPPPEPIDSSNKVPIKTIKTSLSSIISDSNNGIKMNDAIQDAVKNINLILRHSCYMTKLYLLKLLNTSQTFPLLDSHLLQQIMYSVSIHSGLGRKPDNDTSQKREYFTKFFNDYYKPLLGDNINYLHVENSGLTNSFIYEADKLLAMINNNVISQYINRLKQIINCNFGITKNSPEEHTKYVSLIKKHVCDHNFAIPQDIYYYVIYYREKYIPKSKSLGNGTYNLGKKKTLNYNVTETPEEYLESLFLIAKDLEVCGKTFNTFPLKKDNIFSSVTFDYTILKGISLNSKYTGKDTNDFMALYFNFDKIKTPKGCEFKNMFTTDGVSVNLLFGNPGEKISVTQKKNKKLVESKNKELYITDVNPQKYIDKRFATFDPNKDSVLYGVSEVKIKTVKFHPSLNLENKYSTRINNGEDHRIWDEYDQIPEKRKYDVFEYTNQQIKVETKQKRYKILRNEHKLQNPHIQKIEDIIAGCVYQECINEKGEYEKKIITGYKSLNENYFITYLRHKIYYMKILDEFYNHDTLNYRRLRFNTYINTQRSEARMVNRIKTIYGPPNETILVVGDGSNGHKKYKDPVKWIGLRKMLRKYGYEVLLINEFRTTMLCHKCNQPLCSVGYRKSPRPWRNGERRIVNGLKCCKTKNCINFSNRDKNAAINMYNIVIDYFKNGLQRNPLYTRDIKMKENTQIVQLTDEYSV